MHGCEILCNTCNNQLDVACIPRTAGSTLVHNLLDNEEYEKVYIKGESTMSTMRCQTFIPGPVCAYSTQLA